MASVLVGVVVQLVLITQLLYSSFEGTGLLASTVATSSANSQIPYNLLASVVQKRLSTDDDDTENDLPTILELTKTLSNLASHQQTFKGLDGVAHEAYQRTHSSDDVADTSVSGRAQRSASRLAAVAEALYACELVEVAEHPELSLSDGSDSDGNSDGNSKGKDGIFHKREIILNVTLAGAESGVKEATTDLSLSVLVIYEPLYSGGVGLEHGNLLSLTELESSSEKSGERERERERERGTIQKCKGGRLLVVLGHKSSLRTTKRVEILDATPQKIKLSSGLVTNEVASVQPELYKKAGELLTLIEPQLRQYNTSSVHFVGHSLAGGVASLAATILDGSIPMPKKKTKQKPSRKKKKRTNKESEPTRVATTTTTTIDEEDFGNLSKSTGSGEGTKENHDDDQEEEVVPLEPLNGLGRARSSATTLGSPPCLSSNVLAAFCTSFIYGDDIICRTTEDSVSRLLGRVERTMHGGFIGRKLGWMSDTMSLTVSSLQSHAHGSEGEETRLAIPGRAFLVRPRRLGGICSIHEVGNLKKGGREALREALLWQMNDVLLSTSMWKHHDLKSYIHGLDRTQLRGVAEDESDNTYLE